MKACKKPVVELPVKTRILHIFDINVCSKGYLKIKFLKAKLPMIYFQEVLPNLYFIIGLRSNSFVWILFHLFEFLHFRSVLILAFEKLE